MRHAILLSKLSRYGVRKSSFVTKFVLYADDTTVMFKGSDTDAQYYDTNIELVKIVDWYLDNKLAVNFKKTTYLLFYHVSSGCLIQFFIA